MVDRRRAAGPHRPLLPRLGTRLLLQRRREQHLRQAVQPAVRHAALRLRPQVRLFAHRLQPEGDRHPGGHRLRNLKKLDRFVAARRRNWAALRERWRPTPTGCLLPETPPDSEPSYFGFVDHGSRGRRLHAQRFDGFPGSGEDRNPQPVLRQPDPPPGLRGYRVPHRRRSCATPTRIMNDTFFIGVYPGLRRSTLRT